MQIPAGLARDRCRRGVTAVEMIAVVTIIAILALTLIPILRGRVAHSRVVAAREEMALADRYEWVVVNDRLEEAVEQIAQIIQNAKRAG